MSRIRHLLASTALLAATGCYSYTDVPPASVPRGAHVRARISAEEAERLSDVLGREDRVLQGELLGREDGELLIEVPSAVQAVVGSMQQLNQRVSVPLSDVALLEVRRLDRWKTAGVVAAAGAVTTFAAIQAFRAIGEGSEEGKRPGGGGVERVIIPLNWLLGW